MTPRALLSVTDKTGILDLAKGLRDLGYMIVSTGGTAKHLREGGVDVTEVSDITQFPEILDGRVKTLHPSVHAGLLADMRVASHRETMASLGLSPISIVAVNLYAFERTIAGDHSLEDAIESIDIGGPAMVRASAKNHANVTILTDPSDYGLCLDYVRSGEDRPDFRREMAAKAFRHTAYYDSVIGRYLTEAAGVAPMTDTLTIGMRWDGATLRYGENSHQRARRYIDPMAGQSWEFSDDAGKSISYNNWLDAEAAWELVSDLPKGACAIIKHGNPCGAAIGTDLGESYRLARASDPISAFGGIVAFNGAIDGPAVAAMTEKGNFLEVVIGAGWAESGLQDAFMEGAAWTKNVRFLTGPVAPSTSFLTVRSLRGAWLVQDSDEDPGESAWQVVSERQPTDEEWTALRLMWSIVPHVKSNAIVVGSSTRLLGTGAGQMNRVQSVRLALEQAGELAKGAVLASDAFFPFPDSIETAAAAGITAIIQPGGSKKDDEVISAANAAGLAMILTGTRHFRH